jgi:DNA modification methylase
METNKIYLGDCYELIKQIPDKSVDCIYTDIPYLYDKGGCSGTEIALRMAKIHKGEIKDIVNGIDYVIFNEFVRENGEELGDVEEEMEVLDKERNEKEKEVKVNTEECVFDVYYENYAKKYIKDTNEAKERKNVMKNIYYYTSTYLRINSEDIIQKMARERVNYVNVNSYNFI